MDEILNLIESVSEGFPSYSYLILAFVYLKNRYFERFIISPYHLKTLVWQMLT